MLNDSDEFAFDPKRYPALLKQKPDALYQGAPLQGWRLPEPQSARISSRASGNQYYTPIAYLNGQHSTPDDLHRARRLNASSIRSARSEGDRDKDR